MPELPDLVYVMGILRPALIGRTVAASSLREPVVLRSVVKGDLSLLVGRTLDSIERRAHFVVFRFGDLDLAVNPMRGCCAGSRQARAGRARSPRVFIVMSPGMAGRRPGPASERARRVSISPERRGGAGP